MLGSLLGSLLGTNRVRGEEAAWLPWAPLLFGDTDGQAGPVRPSLVFTDVQETRLRKAQTLARPLCRAALVICPLLSDLIFPRKVA